jgi:hypothetical protein
VQPLKKASSRAVVLRSSAPSRPSKPSSRRWKATRRSAPPSSAAPSKSRSAGEEGSVVIGKIHESKDTNFGYNAGTGVYEDLVKSGVIDPTKVTRTALQNAASISGLLLTTEAIIADIPEKKEAAGGGHSHGGGGMEGMY